MLFRVAIPAALNLRAAYKVKKTADTLKGVVKKAKQTAANRAKFDACQNPMKPRQKRSASLPNINAAKIKAPRARSKSK